MITDYSKKSLLSYARQQLALDHNCNPDDFLKAENTLVTPAVNKGRRQFREKPSDFVMATFGKGVVFSAVPQIHDDLKGELLDMYGLSLYEPKTLMKIEKILSKTDRCLYINTMHYLPDIEFERKHTIDDPSYTIKIYHESEIDELYPLCGDFHNALANEATRKLGLRKDMISAVAYDANGEIAGISGASADSDLFWQIGIDTAENHRCKGIATVLVGLITDEIIKSGAIPYYGTWSANIYSQNVARSCGYFPAWTEVIA